MGIFKKYFSSNPDTTSSFGSQLAQQPTPTNSLPVDLLSIDSLKSGQQVYRLFDNATVYFRINDERNLPYNITVNWLNNGTILYGWSDEGNSTKIFNSWYDPIPEKGKWRTQVVLKFEYQGQIYQKDELTEFEVS